MNSHFYLIWIVLFLIIIISLRNNQKMYLKIIQKKRKGAKRMLPEGMMREFVGKVCSISLFNDSFGMVGRIVAVEENWIRVEEKNSSRLVNGDMIRDIKLMPEKYQK